MVHLTAPVHDRSAGLQTALTEVHGEIQERIAEHHDISALEPDGDDFLVDHQPQAADIFVDDDEIPVQEVSASRNREGMPTSKINQRRCTHQANG